MRPRRSRRRASASQGSWRPSHSISGASSCAPTWPGDERPAWLALDAAGAPIASLSVVREAAKLAALCEVAEESAGGGDLPQLRERLREIRETEAPEGIEAAELAAAELAETLEAEPRLATTDYLDRVGAAVRRLEQALGDDAGSPFAAALQQALPAVDEVAAEVERRYKGPLVLGSWKAAEAVASDSRSGAIPRI